MSALNNKWDKHGVDISNFVAKSASKYGKTFIGDLKDFKERNRGYEDSPELFMVFSRLFREVEAKKQVYLTLQQQLELARIEEVKQTSILHILDHATPPSKKSSPKRFLFLVFSAIFGLVSSSLATVFKY